MTSDDPSPSRVILARLAGYGIRSDRDPWNVGFQPDMVKTGDDLPTESEPFSEGAVAGMLDSGKVAEWDAERHAARVSHIMQSPELRNPIEIDCLCSGNQILNIPVILDGWHRLHAHWALRRRHILATFSGNTVLLDYLTGVTNEPPEE